MKMCGWVCVYVCMCVYGTCVFKIIPHVGGEHMCYRSIILALCIMYILQY